MDSYALLCSGPGPHDPPDGVLGEASVADVDGILCVLCAERVPAERPELDTEIEPITTPRDTAPTRTRII